MYSIWEMALRAHLKWTIMMHKCTGKPLQLLVFVCNVRFVMQKSWILSWQEGARIGETVLADKTTSNSSSAPMPELFYSKSMSVRYSVNTDWRRADSFTSEPPYCTHNNAAHLQEDSSMLLGWLSTLWFLLLDINLKNCNRGAGLTRVLNRNRLFGGAKRFKCLNINMG